MKKYAIVLTFLLINGFAFAQRQPVQVQKQPAMTLSNQAALQNLKWYGPDLVPNQQAILNSNGKRFIKAFSLNQGKTASKSCYLIVTYRWKVDYELFTKKEMVKKYTIKPLQPNEATSVIFQVPDDQIYSHKTFGSKNVSIELEVDGTGLVVEVDEQNNSKSVSLPIINH